MWGAFMLFMELMLVSAVVAAIFSFPLYIPSWRRGMQRNFDTRLTTVFLVGLMANLSVYLVLTLVAATAITVFGAPDLYMSHDIGEPMPIETEIRNEIWVRFLLPLQPCYTAQQEICDTVDKRIQANGSEISIGERLNLMGVSVMITIPTIISLLYFSQPKRSQTKFI